MAEQEKKFGPIFHKTWVLKVLIAAILIILAVFMLQYTNGQHKVPETETVTANFIEKNYTTEDFTAENIQANLLTPYSVQGVNVTAGIYYFQQLHNEGLKFTDLYAHGPQLEYLYSNSTNNLGGPGLYDAAYTITMSKVSNEKITINSLYANFGSAVINLNSIPMEPNLQGDFQYVSTGGASSQLGIMQLNTLGNQNFGNFLLSSGVYGPSLVIGTNANATNPLPVLVNGPGGNSTIFVHSKYFIIGNAAGISATFTFGGSFDILSSYLHSLNLSSEFQPFPTFTVNNGSSLAIQTSGGEIVDTGHQTEFESPGQMTLYSNSQIIGSKYETFFTLNTVDSMVTYKGVSIFTSSIYNIQSSSARNDYNILGGTLLGAGAATGLDILDIIFPDSQKSKGV